MLTRFHSKKKCKDLNTSIAAKGQPNATIGKKDSPVLLTRLNDAKVENSEKLDSQ